MYRSTEQMWEKRGGEKEQLRKVVRNELEEYVTQEEFQDLVQQVNRMTDLVTDFIKKNGGGTK